MVSKVDSNERTGEELFTSNHEKQGKIMKNKDCVRLPKTLN